MKPYKEKIINENTRLRAFSESISSADLVWHRDRQDRIVEVIYGDGWMFQRDDSIPVQIHPGTVLEVKAKEWHRIIKGDSDLVVKITERKKKTDGMRSVRKGADKNPKVTKMDFLPDKVLRDIADDMDEGQGHPRQYGAKKGSARAKHLDQTTSALTDDDPSNDAAAWASREREEKKHRDESKKLSETQVKILINDIAEEIKLDAVLNEIEDRIDEKKKKKKKKAAGGLSKKVKKSLDKKADKRCLTRGSVYAEFRAGLAAWGTSGSRKGMSQHQWAHARVNSANPSKKWAKVKKRKKCPKKKKK